MDTKALKKQMGAAIAMVLVAAIALGSATFAWFVTNNNVKATTSTISAQSNAAFMTIANGETGASNSDVSAVATEVATKALFPATFGEQTDSDGQSHAGEFWTGNGNSTNDGTLFGALTKIGTNGSPEEAVTNGYALKQTFNISTKGMKMKDLKVDGVVIGTHDGEETADNNSQLNKALRVLVVDGTDSNSWVVYGRVADENKTDFEIKLSSAQDKTAPNFGTLEPEKDHVVNVYLYYEGSDAKVFTNNLGNLTATNKVTVNFSATADGN